jgi:hypothetical protein
MNVRGWMTACALSAGLCFGSYSFGQVTGKVTLKGEAPQMNPINMAAVPQCAEQHTDEVLEQTVVVGEDNALLNVVVSLKNDGNLEGEAPSEPAVLDQVGCQYVPHVLPMMVGQEIRIKNSDPFLHNVHTLPVDNEAINKGQPNVDEEGMKVKPMSVAEAFPVKCDVHPWMLCHWVVFDHPYFAATGEDGTFSIDLGKLEDGTYTLVFWHEKFGSKEQEVEVKDGKAEVEFEFDAAEEAAAEPVEGDVRLASDVIVPAAGKSDEACKSGGACCKTKANAKKTPKLVAKAS